MMVFLEFSVILAADRQDDETIRRWLPQMFKNGLEILNCQSNLMTN